MDPVSADLDHVQKRQLNPNELAALQCDKISRFMQNKRQDKL
jgi:hypothetical protein